jgi:hypothetical protein
MVKTMNSTIRKTFFLVFFLILFSNVSAELFVKISAPQEKISTLYFNEIKTFDLIISNDDASPVKNLVLNVSVDETLRILKDQKELSSLKFSIDLIPANETIIEKIKIKSISLSSHKNFITVGYGIEEITHASSTFVLISKSPLEVNARLEKTALNIGETSKLIVGIKNVSSEEISNITISLNAENGVFSETKPFKVQPLSPNQSIDGKEFQFTPDPTITGKKKLFLIITFYDSKGVHLIEKTFQIDIQNRSINFYLVVIVIILLIILSYFVGKKTSKKQIEIKKEIPEN